MHINEAKPVLVRVSGQEQVYVTSKHFKLFMKQDFKLFEDV